MIIVNQKEKENTTHITRMWNLNIILNEQVYKTETDSEIQRRDFAAKGE